MEEKKIVFIGHKDHGKSSIIGRLYLDTKSIGGNQIKLIREKAKLLDQRGQELAFVTDQLREEREAGITKGLAHNKLKTKKVQFTIGDSPGHKDFITHMLTGASEAEIAILVVDALEGVKNQTREHLYLAKMVGVPRVIVAINKMDLVGFSSLVFRRLKRDIEKLLFKIGFNPQQTPIIPTSAIKGEGVVKNLKQSWYRGRTLLRLLEKIEGKKLPTDYPLRLPIQNVYHLKGKTLIGGRLKTGKLKIKDKIIINPGKLKGKIQNIYFHHQKIKEAIALDNVLLDISGINPKKIKRGQVITEEQNPPKVRSKFPAWITYHGSSCLKINSVLNFETNSQKSKVKIISINKIYDAANAITIRRKADKLKPGLSAQVKFELNHRICLDRHSEIPDMANFRLLNRLKKVVGFGIVI